MCCNQHHTQLLQSESSVMEQIGMALARFSSWWRDDATSSSPSFIIAQLCRVISPVISRHHFMDLMMEGHLWYCRMLVWKTPSIKTGSKCWLQNRPLCGLSRGSFDKLLECKASHSINQRGFSWRPQVEWKMALKLMDGREIEKRMLKRGVE